VYGETCKTLPDRLVQRKGHAREVLYGDKFFNTLWTGDADLRLYITTVQDG